MKTMKQCCIMEKNIGVKGIQDLTVDSEGQEFCDLEEKFHPNKPISLCSKDIKSLFPYVKR